MKQSDPQLMRQLTVEEIKTKISKVASAYEIQKIFLFGSYFDGKPDQDSDIDIFVDYGSVCRGLKRIRFMQDLEEALGREVDVISTEFTPQFAEEINLFDERRLLYNGQS